MSSTVKRIDAAIQRVEQDHPDNPKGQAMSLRAEVVYSGFLTPADRVEFREAINRLDCDLCLGCGVITTSTGAGFESVECAHG